MDSLTLMLPEEAKRSVTSKHSAWGGRPLFFMQDSTYETKFSSVIDCAERLIENTAGTRAHSLRLLASHASRVCTTQRSMFGMSRCCAALSRNSFGSLNLPSGVR